MFIAGSRVRGPGREIRGFDPHTGRELEPAYGHGDRSHVEAACAAAAAAFGDYRNASAERRAQFLDTIADNIDAISDQLVDRGTPRPACHKPDSPVKSAAPAASCGCSPA